MTKLPSVTKSQFAAMRQVTPGRVSQWISEGKISGDALEGEGRAARIVVEIACRQLGVTLDPVQSIANGQQAMLPVEGEAAPAPPASEPPAFDDQRRMARFKADSAEMEHARKLREFLSENGVYMLAAAGEAAWTKIFAKVIADLEAAIPEMAKDVARDLGFTGDDKRAVVSLRRAFRAWRSRVSALGQSEQAAIEQFVEDPEIDTPPTERLTDRLAERRSEDQAAA